MINIADKIKPSDRGELEITDVNNLFAEGFRGSAIGRGFAWLDTGMTLLWTQGNLFKQLNVDKD